MNQSDTWASPEETSSPHAKSSGYRVEAPSSPEMAGTYHPSRSPAWELSD